jgi:hypothetical protein
MAIKTEGSRFTVRDNDVEEKRWFAAPSVCNLLITTVVLAWMASINYVVLGLLTNRDFP